MERCLDFPALSLLLSECGSSRWSGPCCVCPSFVVSGTSLNTSAHRADAGLDDRSVCSVPPRLPLRVELREPHAHDGCRRGQRAANDGHAARRATAGAARRPGACWDLPGTGLRSEKPHSVSVPTVFHRGLGSADLCSPSPVLSTSRALFFSAFAKFLCDVRCFQVLRCVWASQLFSVFLSFRVLLRSPALLPPTGRRRALRAPGRCTTTTRSPAPRSTRYPPSCNRRSKRRQRPPQPLRRRRYRPVAGGCEYSVCARVCVCLCVCVCVQSR